MKSCCFNGNHIMFHGFMNAFNIEISIWINRKTASKVINDNILS